MSCRAAMAVSHWDSFQEEAENPLPLRSVPAPAAGTRATPRPLPSSGPTAVPVQATGGTAPPHPKSPRSQGLDREGLAAAVGHAAGNGVERVGTPGPCPHCLLVRVPGLILQRSEPKPREVACVAQSHTASEGLGAPSPLYPGCGPALPDSCAS